MKDSMRITGVLYVTFKKSSIFSKYTLILNDIPFRLYQTILSHEHDVFSK